MRNRSVITGLLLIGVGALFLADNLHLIEFRWDKVWPLVLMIGGVFFWVSWLSNRKDIGLLMPGTILFVYGGIFLASEYYWVRWDYLWPFFLIGPGAGFLLMYWLGERDRGLLIPGGILTGLGVLFLSGEHVWDLIWPLALIVIGVGLLVKHYREQRGGGEPGGPAES